MKRIFATFALFGILLIGACSKNAATVADADTASGTNSAINSTNIATSIFYNGTIITMEKDAPRAEAVVAGSNGRILFVGDKETAFKQFPKAKKINLKNKVLMPGLIEQHLHPFLGALALNMPVIAPEEWILPSKTWPAVANHEEYIKTLTALEKSMKDPNEILWTWGYNNFFHGALSRKELDAISATRPIGIWHRSAHEFYVNTAFIKKFGLLQEDIDAMGKDVAAQVDLGKGHFFEAGAMLYLLPRIFPELGNDKRFRAGLIQMVALLHQNGVTAYSEPGAFIPANMVATYEEILGAKDTPMYSFFVPESKTPYFMKGKDGVLEEVEKITTMFPKEGKIRFFDKQVKILFDGAIISQLMQMKDGYEDGHHGEWIQNPEETEVLTKIFWENDYQIIVHVNGDLGVEELITILERRQAEYPREDHRLTLAHFANSTDEQVKKLKKLGVLISVNPYYVTGFGEKFGEVGLGEERAHSMVRLATIEKENISISLHSDMPMAPAAPLFLAWSAATRNTNEGTTLRPDLALSRDAALRAITIDAAYSWQMENELGSIKTGKIANFTILEENPYLVDINKLKDIPIYGTVFEGRVFPIKK